MILISTIIFAAIWVIALHGMKDLIRAFFPNFMSFEKMPKLMLILRKTTIQIFEHYGLEKATAT